MTSVRLDQFSNPDYKPGPLVKRALWYWLSLLFFDTAIPWPRGWKRLLLRVMGARIGKSVVIKPRVRIKYPWKLSVGHHSWLGEGVWIDNLDMVDIGSHCCVSQGAYLLCGNHDYTKITFDLITGPITMEDGSWAGAQSILGPGSILGKEAVLTAGSVGLGRLVHGKIHQGNPAQPIRDRTIAT